MSNSPAGNIPGFVHLYAGEEASAVGVCMHLTDRDNIASTHRGHGHCIAKGCDVEGMMAEIYGRRDGLCGGKGGSMHIADLSKGMLGANGIVGGGPPLICGAALTAKILKTGGVAVAFIGDGASNQGTTLESLQPRQRLEAAGDLRRRGQRLGRVHGRRIGGRRQSGQARRGLRHAGPARSMAMTSSPSTTRRVRRSNGRGQARGRACSTSSSYRYYGHFEGDAMTYRGPG